MSGVERVLAEVKADIGEGVEHQFDMLGPYDIRIYISGLATDARMCRDDRELRQRLVRLSALCVAAIAAIDAPAGSEAKR